MDYNTLIIFFFYNIAFVYFIFFFSSRRRHTRFSRDWSSDVCSSDLKKTPINIPVSVIICAKNEAENLKKFLPSVINQDYPNFQIVLINDASYDDTFKVMEEFANKHNNIKLVNVVNNEAFWANKKYALTLGIKAAKHNHLLFTDADCKPLSKHWITEMSSCF